MPINVLYWLCWFLLLLSGGVYFTGSVYSHYGFSGGGLILFLMLFLIGWRDFGRPIT